jgi:hypothetical protein
MVSSIETPKTIKTSFELHSNEELTFIGKLYTKTSKGAQVLLDLAKTDEEKDLKLKALQQLHAKRKLLLDTARLAEQRKGLPVLLDFYQDELAKTNPAIFRFLTAEQKIRLKNQLLFTYFLLFAQYQLDAAEGRNYTLNQHQEALDLCSKRIQELDLSPQRGKKIDFQDDLQIEISLFTKCLYYLGLTILAEWIVERIEEFMENKTGALIRWMSEINVKRLYWIWGGGMLASALDMMPADFFNSLDAGKTVAMPSPVTGYMSFVLYYARLGVNLFLLCKHTLGPWICEGEESKIPAWQRFTTQWNQRKFAILNDLFWGPINMVCFFWLRGRSFLGFAGNIATVFLLALDLSLSIWRHWEETTKHEADMLAIKRDRAALKDQRDKHALGEMAAMKKGEIQPWLDKQKDLEEQIKRLDKMQAKAKFDWKYKDLNFFNDCCYALALMLAFCVVICFFCPPFAMAPLSVAIIGLIGAVLCFLITTIYTARSSQLEISKTQEQSQLTRAECEEIVDGFKKEQDPMLKKQLYLEIKTLMAQSDYQRKVADFQLKKAIRSVLIDALFPFVVLLSLVFLPTGLGLGIIAAALAVAIISYAIINQYEPKTEEFPDFDKEDYKEFTKNPNLSHFESKEPKKSRGFFNAEPSADYYKLAVEKEITLDTALVC